ncbi:hypothetical protein CHY68_04860 [Salmonella enterica]|uniref:Inner membrane protein n=4 Tax=Salmonella enterica I TaxID=59201 RepID=A0A3V9Q371_SALET|nr:hypothetical protein [Salmonella enterica]EAA4270036.1 hypothetical protein [Salmonella enterica subsp. enterica serovar Altona]EAY3324572.1 hypothetical protein [Salmonella enterica subsp. enterica serovar Typhimurium]EBU9915627.1 hypothetical protein [Salmonella enterica subsp. enterica serovar Weybridge]EBW5403280.1 hypothetical protein [Salmonella enterica subsp. enterica serovar Southampton]EBY8830377.1 hypothetical protein [Salmonella enterica subsp. enterica serovar Schwarzengrund]E
MRLKVKENITLWRNEGLIAYVALGFLCTFFMEVNALLPYYLQQSIFFETLMSYMAFNTLFSLALSEIFFAMLVVICHNTKLEKITNSILQELHKRIMQGSFIISFLCFGIFLFCVMAFCIGSLTINNNYYGKHVINFACPFVLFLSFPYLIHKGITILCTLLKAFPKHKIHAAIIILLIIAAAIIIPGIFNKKQKMTITIDKEKYHAIEQKTKIKPEKYIEKKINDININDIK